MKPRRPECQVVEMCRNTTTLFLILAGSAWGWPMWRLMVIGAVFGGLELTFFAANLTKVAHSGWLAWVDHAGLVTA